MRPVVAQFDIDGVLADFALGFTRLAQRMNINVAPKSDVWRTQYGFDDLMLQPEVDAVWRRLVGSLTFWLDLTAHVPPSLFQRINDFVDHGGVAYFVTNRMGVRVKEQTEEWLQVMGVRHPTVVLTPRKGEFAHAVGATHSVEDKAGNAVYIAYESPKTESYLVDRPYNRFDPTVLGSKVARIDGAEHFMTIVEKAQLQP